MLLVKRHFPLLHLNPKAITQLTLKERERKTSLQCFRDLYIALLSDLFLCATRENTHTDLPEEEEQATRCLTSDNVKLANTHIISIFRIAGGAGIIYSVCVHNNKREEKATRIA